MGMMTIDEMMELLPNAYTQSTDHPNETILNKSASAEMQRVSKFCNDCRNMWPPAYRVDKELWALAVPEEKCHLCLVCFDKRVLATRGSKLTHEDFDGIPMNQGVLFGYTMAQSDERS